MTGPLWQWDHKIWHGKMGITRYHVHKFDILQVPQEGPNWFWEKKNVSKKKEWIQSKCEKNKNKVLEKKKLLIHFIFGTYILRNLDAVMLSNLPVYYLFCQNT